MNHHQPSPPRQPTPCATFARLAPLLDTGELGPEQETEARDHLRTCVACQKRFASYEIATAALRRHYGGMRSPVALPTAEEIMRTADMEAFHEDSQTAPFREPLPPRAPERRRWRGWRPLGAALTAAMVLAIIGTLFALRGQSQTTGPGAGKTPQASSSGKVVEVSLGGRLSSPTSLAVDKSGSVWMLDPQQNAIGYWYLPDSTARPPYNTFVWVAPTANSGLTGLAIAPDGSVWFTEANADQIGRIIPRPSTASSTGGSTVIEFGGSSINEFKGPGFSTNSLTGARPYAITAGSNGVMWFTELNSHAGYANGVAPIQHDGTTGNVLLMPYPDPGMVSITRASDGALWLVEAKTGYVDRLDPALFNSDPRNSIKRYALPNSASDPIAIAAGPGGSIWFAERGANAIGRMSPSGKVTEFPVPTPNSGLADLAVAADGSVWFTESKANRIGHMSPGGAITEIAVPTASAGLNGIAIAPNGKVWFSETASGKIGYVTP